VAHRAMPEGTWRIVRCRLPTNRLRSQRRNTAAQSPPQQQGAPQPRCAGSVGIRQRVPLAWITARPHNVSNWATFVTTRGKCHASNGQHFLVGELWGYFGAAGDLPGTGTPRRRWPGTLPSKLDVGAPVLSVAVTPDGKYVVSGSNDKTVRLWELATGKEVRRFTGHERFRSLASR
jgi:WD40 repeat protein